MEVLETKDEKPIELMNVPSYQEIELSNVNCVLPFRPLYSSKKVEKN